MLGDPKARILAHLKGYVGTNGAQYGSAIARACSMSKATFDKHVPELEREGLVTSNDSGVWKTYTPTRKAWERT